MSAQARPARQPTDDWRAIEQVLYRYAWMVDRREWQLMDDVFAPGATIDYSSTGGRKSWAMRSCSTSTSISQTAVCSSAMRSLNPVA